MLALRFGDFMCIIICGGSYCFIMYEVNVWFFVMLKLVCNLVIIDFFYGVTYCLGKISSMN